MLSEDLLNKLLTSPNSAKFGPEEYKNWYLSIPFTGLYIFLRSSEKIKQFSSSLIQPSLLFHSFSIYPPNFNLFIVLIIVIVFDTPSTFLWKSSAVAPSLVPLYINSYDKFLFLK